jgi:hypothetical protein
VTWQTPKKEGHPDYKRNLESANKFIERTKKSLLRGMDVKVCDGESIPKALLRISWSAPKDAPMGNYATPISLHQPTSNMNKQVEGVFNAYMVKAAQFNQRFPHQPEFLPPDSKV